MATSDLYHVVCHCNTGARNWDWTWDYQQVAGTNDARTMEELAIAFNLAFQDPVTDIFASDAAWEYTHITGYKGVDEIGGAAQVIAGDGQQGGTAIPQNMAIKALWITTALNSKHNGSTSWSCCSADDQDNGRLTAGAQTRLATLISDLQGNLVSIGTGNAEFQPVVVSRIVNGGVRPSPVPFAIIDALGSTRLGNMRRRTPDRFIQPPVIP